MSTLKVKPVSLSTDLSEINWRNLWGYKGNDRYMLLLVAISAIVVMVLMINYIMDESIWTVEPDTDEVVNSRQKSRGMVTSIITSVFSMIVSVIMVIGIKSDSAMYQTLVNILCVGIVGFILDNAFATENGVRILLNGINNDDSSTAPSTDPNNESFSLRNASDALQYSFGSLLSPKIARYAIVTMLDIFVSLMLTDSIVWALTQKLGVDMALADIFAMVVVAVTTFLAYANATRLEWAYPAVDEFYERSGLIQTSTILISCVLAGMIFLQWTPAVGDPIGIKSPLGKLTMVLIMLLLIVIAYYGGFLNPVLKYEIKRDVVPCSGEPPDSTKRCVDSEVFYTEISSSKDLYDMGIYGLLIFLIITVLSVIFTTAMGQKKFDWSRLAGPNLIMALVVIGVLNIPGIVAIV
jgi:hypothetical protein